jgi:hypothetical protein
MDERVIVIPLSPPRRLLAPDRWRTFKTKDDRQLWTRLLEPVERLIGEGYQVTRVEVDWGSSRPHGVETQARQLTRCEGGCTYADTYGNRGRGTTTVHLERGGDR